MEPCREPRRAVLVWQTGKPKGRLSTAGTRVSLTPLLRSNTRAGSVITNAISARPSDKPERLFGTALAHRTTLNANSITDETIAVIAS